MTTPNDLMKGRSEFELLEFMAYSPIAEGFMAATPTIDETLEMVARTLTLHAVEIKLGELAKKLSTIKGVTVTTNVTLQNLSYGRASITACVYNSKGTNEEEVHINMGTVGAYKDSDPIELRSIGIRGGKKLVSSWNEDIKASDLTGFHFDNEAGWKRLYGNLRKRINSTRAVFNYKERRAEREKFQAERKTRLLQQENSDMPENWSIACERNHQYLKYGKNRSDCIGSEGTLIPQLAIAPQNISRFAKLMEENKDWIQYMGEYQARPDMDAWTEANSYSASSVEEIK